MLFTEARFFIWLAFSLLAFWAAPAAARATVLLILSLAFWLLSSLEGSAWLAVAFVITWIGGRRIERAAPDSAERLAWLRVSLGLLVGMLAFAKFGPRLFPELRPWIGREGSLGGLPLGISYYTFHCLGYLLDVHWSKEKAMNPRTLGLYLTFFPKAVMGPIERSGRFQAQTAALPTVRWSPAEVGPACFQICTGLFLKFVLADRIRLLVDGYYQSPADHHNIPGALVAVMFCWQLYYDFFGYSLMAVGIGRLFGFKLPNNFNRPFFVSSISDFWNRWHISLSSWFLDYFYTPVRFQLRRRRKLALILAGISTFLALGIWHGTGWTFVLLGLLNGIPITIEALYPKLREHSAAVWIKVLRGLAAFLIIAFTLVLFRSPSLSVAGTVFSQFLTWETGSIQAITDLLPKFDWLLVIAFAVLTELLTWRGFIAGHGDACAWIARLGIWGRTWALALVIALTWAFGMFGKTTFLYNQF